MISIAEILAFSNWGTFVIPRIVKKPSATDTGVSIVKDVLDLPSARSMISMSVIRVSSTCMSKIRRPITEKLKNASSKKLASDQINVATMYAARA